MFNTLNLKKQFLTVLLLIGCLGGLLISPNKSQSQSGVPPQEVADYIHAVIEADRTLYTTKVVDRMQELGVVISSHLWKMRGQLPLPAQMLLMAGMEVEAQGTGLKYRLASLWPIGDGNGPVNDFEKTGLEVLVEDPSEVYAGTITRGNLRYFKAIYADKAVSMACVNCHNAHQLSPKRDFKVGDVMGGLIISFPLPREEMQH